TMMLMPVFALLLVKVPFSGELTTLLLWLFYKMYVDPGHNDPKKNSGKRLRYDFPYRVPFMARIFDGSIPGYKLGNGITFLGKEISTKLEIWTGDSDMRTHMLVLGTTGSGKTEFLLGLVYNALVQNSGFIYTDGKGDVALFNNVFRLARYLGREDDLVVINFLTSGRDFLDKQKDRTTNTMNPFALGSSGMLIELIISLMDDAGGGGDMWKGRAIAFVAGLTRALCFLRDRGYLLLDANKFIEYFELPIVEKMVWDRIITENGAEIKIDDPLFTKVLEPLKAFILTLPGYKREAKGNQEQKTVEQHGFITMQLTRLFGDMSFTYGYIFQTTLGEVDMYDVVINRRILVVLLPALERAPDSLKMLGKLVVGSIKQMMAGCLGNRLEGSVREIVEARPTNAVVPFYIVLDEYGYYAVLGFAVAPAQARSLGFPQPKYARVKLANGSTVAMRDIKVGDAVMLPTGASAPVTQILDHGVLPCSRIVLEDGKTVDAANVHHWPTRTHNQQFKLLTTLEIAEMVEAGVAVELSHIEESGSLEWKAVTKVQWLGLEEVQCLVVD
ncbi:MAG TPA: FtsK/SpoIIIE domain-containing protein, partial [Methylobacter sp.]